jgi:dipeptidyl aminopeptidase/acylaminoacyl peptidase
MRCDATACIPSSWSKDGRYLLYTQVTMRTKRGDIWAVPLQGERKPFPVLSTNASEVTPSLSPDGRWLAYVSDESGADEVYVRPFLPASGDSSGAGPKWLVSSGGGRFPFWSPDGKRLAYVNSEAVTVVNVSTDPVFRAGTRETGAKLPAAVAGTIGHHNVQRVLLAVPVTGAGAPLLNVVLHWPALLK